MFPTLKNDAFAFSRTDVFLTVSLSNPEPSILLSVLRQKSRKSLSLSEVEQMYLSQGRYRYRCAGTALARSHGDGHPSGGPAASTYRCPPGGGRTA